MLAIGLALPIWKSLVLNIPTVNLLCLNFLFFPLNQSAGKVVILFMLKLTISMLNRLRYSYFDAPISRVDKLLKTL